MKRIQIRVSEEMLFRVNQEMERTGFKTYSSFFIFLFNYYKDQQNAKLLSKLKELLSKEIEIEF